MESGDLLTFQKKLVCLFDEAPIKHHFGMDLSYNSKNEAVFTLPYNPKLNHALQDTHGGVLATLLDNAGWFTVAAYYGCWVVTVDLNLKLLEPVGQQNLVATGHLVRTGKILSVAEMEVCRSDHKKIAIGSGTFSVTSKSIEGTQKT